MPDRMTPRERVEAALCGEAADRVPLCFWHHFKPNRSGSRLAELTLEFFRDTFRLDIVKVMPDLPYPWPKERIREAADIRRLPRLSVEDTPMFREQLVCVRTLREELGPDYPIIVTLFSPVTTLLRFVGRPFSRAIGIARSEPEAFEAGLDIVAANLRGLMAALMEAGASGIFYSCMGATTAEFTAEEYERFGRAYDEQALAGARGGWCNVVHIHADPRQKRERLHFQLFDGYPVQVLSWSDRLTGPSLREALSMTDKCLMGGLYERGPITKGGEAEIAAEIADAIDQTGGRRLILANGCSIPDDTPEHWLHTARTLLDTRFAVPEGP
jgi:uroporphyrinogen decarboxylase